MIPALAGIFGAGAACSVAFARAADRKWAWIAAFLNLLLAFHELSFALQPTAEWIRIDLLLTLPLFTAGNLLLAWLSFRGYAGWWVAGLTLSALAAPVWFFAFR
ncbi:MAG: hypothetical protein HYX27_21920 [Acidobacteria bacterium]|nr:hypothetical protein [Acidobacteriota bacterium]